ncbi:hypothetical protein [Hyphomicrobium sp.]|jgi:hypothetical protein|uniref:hypothetical protein n=1 Tax=Hyphomicrobium sp. TaxID=82 RepID=UPI0035689F4D
MTAASAIGQAVSLDGNGVMRAWRTTPADLSTLASGYVASAKVQLDLSKLTMADFGDVEPAR